VNEELRNALIELREADVLAIVDRELADGTDPLTIIETCRSGMEAIGDRFACGEAFIPELVMAGEIMSSVAGTLKPHLKETSPGETLGTIVIGTVSGDIHDIGKQIVATMLDVAGFEVVDVGVDLSPEQFVEAAKQHEADIIGLSCLLTQAIKSMEQTVAAVSEAELGGATKVMIGGAPVTEGVCAHTGADGWGKDAVEAVELAKTWMRGG